VSESGDDAALTGNAKYQISQASSARTTKVQSSLFPKTRTLNPTINQEIISQYDFIGSVGFDRGFRTNGEVNFNLNTNELMGMTVDQLLSEIGNVEDDMEDLINSMTQGAHGPCTATCKFVTFPWPPHMECTMDCP
jgi:hypothetical protein